MCRSLLLPIWSKVAFFVSANILESSSFFAGASFSPCPIVIMRLEPHWQQPQLSHTSSTLATQLCCLYARKNWCYTVSKQRPRHRDIVSMCKWRPAMGGEQPSTFGEQLRRYREAAGLSQEDLAERAGLTAS